MIKIINNTVCLNKEDYKTLDGIWGAFRSDLNYCADLLKFSTDNYIKLKKDIYSCAKVDKTLKYEDYKQVFILVFKQHNFKIEEE